MSELSELFARDPLGLTDPDLDVIIARMREAQTKHDLGIPTVIAPKAPKAPKKATLDLLKDLGLG
jgi:hypothetical protein